jgi:hypothetical protein
MRFDLSCTSFILISFAGCIVQLDETSSDLGFDNSQTGFELGTFCGSVPTCSITNDLCQNSVLRVTACIRGDDMPELPSIRVITRAELREELKDKDAEKPSRTSIATRNALASLKLVAANTTLAEAQLAHQASSVAAFYRLDEKDVSIVSDGIEDQREAMTTLAHEFTHYLQDRAGQLDVVRGEHASTDQHLAREALTEGDAILTSLRAAVSMRGGRLASERWPEVIEALEQEVAKQSNAAKSPLVAAWNLLPYSLSLSALTGAWERGGHADINAYFDEPPSSALDWLNDGTGPNWHSRPELQCYPPLAPEGYELVGTDSLGLLGLYSLLSTEQRASVKAAADWRNDVLAIYAEKADETADSLRVQLVWRIAFADAASAERFADRIAATGLAITRKDAELTISASSDRERQPFSAEQLAKCASREQLEAALPDDDHAAAMRVTPSLSRY